MKRKSHLLALSICFGVAAPAFSQDVPGSKYEDDAWYDITEYFDGNDYNPTDEALGRWDDEQFSYYDARTSGDEDNDLGIMTFGDAYDGADAERYQAYDDDDDGVYERSTRYYDAAGDGVYDSYAEYEDSDADGVYDTQRSYYSGDDDAVRTRSRQMAIDGMAGFSGRSTKINGTVSKTMMIDSNGSLSIVAMMKGNDGKMVTVDLGQGSTKRQIFEGTKLSATGPMIKVGSKQVLMADHLVIDGANFDVPRKDRTYTGTVQTIRSATVRGEKHTVAKVKTADGKMMTVDMGTQPGDVNVGDRVTVSGVVSQLKDRVVLIATDIAA